MRDVLYKAMDLYGATMRLPETKLVLWDVICYLWQFHQERKQNSLKTLEKVGSRLIITMRARFHCLN